LASPLALFVLYPRLLRHHSPLSIDYCTANGYPPPEFDSEAGLTTTSPDGSTSTTGIRVWCIVGELKFELPRPKSVEDGTEKLAGRVLKHLTAEVEKRK